MRAVVITEPGGPEALMTVDVAAPVPGQGEIRIRVSAAGVNPVDLMVRRGVFHQFGWIDRASVGLGIEVSGVVDTTGPGVQEPVAGTRVAVVLSFASAPSLGYAEYVVVPASEVAVVPDGMPLASAATVPLNALTAAQALDALGPARQGRDRSLLVTGAAGAVGGFATALAVRLGFDVTGLARAADADRLRAAGARPVVDLSATPAFDAVVDAAALGAAAIGAVRDGGDYVGLIGVAPQPSEREITVHTIRYRPDGPRLAGLLRQAAAGELPLRPVAEFPLTEAAAAHRRMEAGGLRERLLLVP